MSDLLDGLVRTRAPWADDRDPDGMAGPLCEARAAIATRAAPR